jgi:hypothetical protein
MISLFMGLIVAATAVRPVWAGRVAGIRCRTESLTGGDIMAYERRYSRRSNRRAGPRNDVWLALVVLGVIVVAYLLLHH